MAADGGTVTLSGSVRSWSEKDRGRVGRLERPGRQQPCGTTSTVVCARSRTRLEAVGVGSRRRGDSPPSLSRGSHGSDGRSVAAVRFIDFGTRIEETCYDEDSAKTHDGKVVSVAGDKLTTTCGEGKTHCHTVAKDAKVTCDGQASKAADLKAGTHVRVTTPQGRQDRGDGRRSGKHIPATGNKA